jgi:hypothetical protein
LLPVAVAVPVVNIATETKIKAELAVVQAMPEMAWFATDTTTAIAVQEALNRPVVPMVVEVKRVNSVLVAMLGPAAADIPPVAAVAAGMVAAVATTMAAAAAAPATLTLA